MSGKKGNDYTQDGGQYPRMTDEMTPEEAIDDSTGIGHAHQPRGLSRLIG